MSKHLQELGELMERALSPQPYEPSQHESHVYVDGKSDRTIVVHRNGHCIGMISVFALAQVMDVLKGRAHWNNGEPASFLAKFDPDEYRIMEFGYEFKPDSNGNLVGNFYTKKTEPYDPL